MNTTLQPVVYGDRQLKEETLLGWLIMYSASSVRFPHEAATALYEEKGLKDIAKPLPAKPRDADTFARVVGSEFGRCSFPTDNADIVENYLIRPVTTTLRKIVAEEVNVKGEMLSHRQVAEIRFANGAPKVTILDHNSYAEEVCERLVKDYESWRGCLNSYHVREWVRESIIGLHSTALKAGVYFVHPDALPKVETIESFCSEIPGRVRLHSLPIVDNQKQRELVAEAFESEATTALESLMEEIDSLRSEGSVTQRRLDTLTSRFVDLTERAEEYEELLEQKLLASGGRAGMLRKKLVDLSRMVAKPGKTS